MAPRLSPAPVRVVLVEATSDIPDISPARDDGGEYQRALLFALRDGRLVGRVEVDLHSQVLAGDDVAGLLKRTLGERWTAPAAAQVVAPDEQLPFLSVVVATTMERIDQLHRCVRSLLDLDYPGFEVILVDNRPGPGHGQLYQVLSRDPRVRVVPEPRPGISAARNRGASLARADVVAFTDDDAVVHHGWLRGIGARVLQDPLVDCVSGVVLPAELETPAQIWFEGSGSKLEQHWRTVLVANDGSWRGRRLGWMRRARYEVTVTDCAEPPHQNTPEVPVRLLIYRAGKFGMGVNIAFRKSSLQAIGGFDESLGTGTAARGAEDIAAIARLLYRGGRVVMDPAVIVRHFHRRDYDGCRRQMYGYGVGLTAAFAALALTDPRHVVGLGHMALPGLRVLARRSSSRRTDGYPRDLARTEFRGLLAGPFAYARSRHRHRWRTPVA